MPQEMLLWPSFFGMRISRSTEGNVACYVVSLSDRNTQYTWWIDNKNSQVVREDSDKVSTIFTTIKLGEALPDELFKFAPPPGARKNEPDHR